MRTLSFVALLVFLVGAFDSYHAASAPTSFSVIPLPYAEDALEPAISNRTVSFHYGKHVPAYVANLNDALKNVSSSASGGKNETLSAVIKNAGDNKTSSTAIRNNGGGAWNHFLYFNQFRPSSSNGSSSELPKELKREIDLSFGSFSDMAKKLEAASLGVFGSGWAWLVWTGDKAKPLAVETTPNQDNPLMKKLGYSGHIPILGIDVWVRKKRERGFLFLFLSFSLSLILISQTKISNKNIKQKYQTKISKYRSTPTTSTTRTSAPNTSRPSSATERTRRPGSSTGVRGFLFFPGFSFPCLFPFST